MPRPLCRVSPIGRDAGSDELERLADALLDPPMSDHRGAQLVLADPRPAGGGEVELRRFPHDVHPADALLGARFPARWTVAGVVASGTAHRLDDGTRTRVQVVVLVDRRGRCVHRVEADGPLPDVSGSRLEGRLVDLVQRSLGLPTAPPDVPPSVLWDVLWLDAIVADAAEAPTRRRAIGDVLRLHPLAAPDDEVARDPVWDEVQEWRTVRRAVVGTAPPTPTDRLVRRAVGPLVGSDVAEWMDEGCLSRWVIQRLPPATTLLDAVGALLPSGLASRVREAIDLPEGYDPRGDVIA